KLNELSVSANSSWASWSGTNKQDGASPVTLILSGQNQFSAHLTAVNNVAEVLYVVPSDAANLTPASPQIAGFNSIALEKLPKRWIDYTGFDLMIASVDEL